MKAVLTLQWATPEGIKTWDRSGIPYYTVERMEKVMTEAYEAGRKVGDSEGRVALRQLFEAEGVDLRSKEGKAL